MCKNCGCPKCERKRERKANARIDYQPIFAPTPTHKPVSVADFIRAWNSSTTIDEVCAKTGMLRGGAEMRAQLLRRKLSDGLGTEYLRRL